VAEGDPADVPGAQTALIQGSGHSPNAEKPAQTAGLILRFVKPLHLLPAPPGLRPLGHVLSRAKTIPNPVLAAVADKQHVDLPKLAAAKRARMLGLVNPGRLGERTRLPVGTLNRPGHDVLEAAKDRAALPRRLVGAKAV
jgi:hypothetical protein